MKWRSQGPNNSCLIGERPLYLLNPQLHRDTQEILRQIQSDKTLHKRNNAMKVSGEAPELSESSSAAGSQNDMTTKCPEKSCVGGRKYLRWLSSIEKMSAYKLNSRVTLSYRKRRKGQIQRTCSWTDLKMTQNTKNSVQVMWRACRGCTIKAFYCKKYE